MKPTISLLRRSAAAAAFLACAALSFAATPSRHEVMVAIATLEKDITGPDADDAAKVVVTFAKDSDDVLVDIGPLQLPWTDEKWDLAKDVEQTFQARLLAAFVAGNIRSQMRNFKAEDDTYSGWIFAISAYNRLRAKTSFHSPAIDQLSKMQTDGTLLQHARDIRSQEDEDDPQDTPKTPLARAAGRARAA